MRIRMLKDDKGSQTGAITESFVKGGEYHVSDDLARNFVAAGSAEYVDTKAPTPEVKAQEAAPENKVLTKRSRK